MSAKVIGKINLPPKKDVKMIPVQFNDYQKSGSGWQQSSSSMRMVFGDFYDLVEEYRTNQNVYVGDDSLLHGVPLEIVNQLNLFGGSVEWSETSDTYTWETSVSKVVYDHNGETIWLQECILP